MATQGTFKNGAGQDIAFSVAVAPDPTGTFKITVFFDSDNKDLQCKMYGQLIADPADPVGQRNLIEKLSAAITTEATSPNAPSSAAMAAMIPGLVDGYANEMVTVGEIRKACSWGEAFG